MLVKSSKKKKINFVLKLNISQFKMFGLLKVLGLTKKCLRINVKDASFFAASAEKSSDNRHMIVRFNNSENAQKDEQLKYPLIWLRDNCQCPNCFHSQTKSRSIDWTKFNHKNSQFKSVSVSNFQKQNKNVHNIKKKSLGKKEIKLLN